jgi:hypothetical protein
MSFTLPPRTRTIECSWRLWPMPGMYAVTSTPEVRRTRATFRRAELGFLGVAVYTRVHTPRRCGEPLRAGDLVFSFFSSRPCRTSCWMVGTCSAFLGHRPPGASHLCSARNHSGRPHLCAGLRAPPHAPCAPRKPIVRPVREIEAGRGCPGVLPSTLAFGDLPLLRRFPGQPGLPKSPNSGF